MAIIHPHSLSEFSRTTPFFLRSSRTTLTLQISWRWLSTWSVATVGVRRSGTCQKLLAEPDTPTYWCRSSCEGKQCNRSLLISEDDFWLYNQEHLQTWSERRAMARLGHLSTPRSQKPKGVVSCRSHHGLSHQRSSATSTAVVGSQYRRRRKDFDQASRERRSPAQ